jgi:hypothetical protein
MSTFPQRRYSLFIPCIGTRRRAIDVDTLRTQIVDAHRVLIQMPFKLCPAAIVTQLPKDDFKAISSRISLTRSVMMFWISFMPRE